MNNIVLVPTDFSEVCANAISQAAEAAKFLKYKLSLLHVIDKSTKSHLKKESLSIESIDEKLNDIAIKIKNDYNIEVDHISKEGDIFTTIADVAKNIGANLIFLGTHGKVGVQKLTGSFALKVVTNSPVPVIVVQKRQFDKGYKDIVLPITSDSGPWEKTKWATYIAKNFGASIHVFQIEGKKIDSAVELITGHFEKENISYTIKKVGSSNFSKQVIDYATSKNSDLIMIMTNPDKSFKTFILGSYDEEMIFNASQIPVMCINPRKYNWEKFLQY
ncbi:MAG: universal stress protein [Bacteroidales bacterium]|nr:universal stress protein [Bacteroidales bacterium]